MWNWVFSLRNCFGANQNKQHSPASKEKQDAEGPVSVSKPSGTIPTLQNAPLNKLQWGHQPHPNTPGSQREEVLQSGIPAGLRHRQTPACVSLSGHQSQEEEASPAYYSAKASIPGKEASADSIRYNPVYEPPVPFNLDTRLADEASPSGQHRAEPRPGISQAQGPNKRRPAKAVHAGVLMPNSSVTNHVGKKNPASSSIQQARTSSRHAGISHQHAQAGNVAGTRALKGLPHKPGTQRAPTRLHDSSTRQQVSSLSHRQKRDESPLVQKRKSSSITASPANKLAQGSAPDGILRGHSKTAVLNTQSLEKSRAQPRPRLTVDVLATQEGEAELGVLEDIEMINSTQSSPCRMQSSPAAVAIKSPRRSGKENQIAHSLQLASIGSLRDSQRDLQNGSQSPRVKQLKAQVSPTSNGGASPRDRFIYSHDSVFGTPGVVGFRNQDADFREDQHLKVFDTPFDIRVERLIEKEQAYRKQLALKRRNSSTRKC